VAGKELIINQFDDATIKAIISMLMRDGNFRSLTQNQPLEYTGDLPQTSGLYICEAPTGGLPAASGTTASSAMCQVAAVVLGSLPTPSLTITPLEHPDSSPVELEITNVLEVEFEEGTQFLAAKGASGRIIAISASGGGGAGGACPCSCISAGDVTVDGYESTSQWKSVFPTVEQVETYGVAVFPGGVHTMTLDIAEGYWIKDIGDDLTARYNDGSDATGDSTLAGTLILRKDESGFSTCKLTITATIPAPV
jgi:hypothetical protein